MSGYEVQCTVTFQAPAHSIPMYINTFMFEYVHAFNSILTFKIWSDAIVCYFFQFASDVQDAGAGDQELGCITIDSLSSEILRSCFGHFGIHFPKSVLVGYFRCQADWSPFIKTCDSCPRLPAESKQNGRRAPNLRSKESWTAQTSLGPW